MEPLKTQKHSEPLITMYASVSLAMGMLSPRSFEYKVPQHLIGSVEAGSLVWIGLHKKKRWGIVESLHAACQFEGPHKEIMGLLEIPANIRRIAYPIIKNLSLHYGTSLGLAAKAVLPVSLILRAKSGHGNPSIYSAIGGDAIKLSSDQQDLLTSLQKNFQGPRRPMYCWGPTGSGKTFVLLAFITEILRQGYRAIYLVPEIALTPQFLEIFLKELPAGTTLACWSSQLGNAQRKEIWEKTAAGEISVILGTRSAVFSPMPNLGAILLDEEQDSSFKQEPPPSYHAREVAFWRAREESAVAVLASATPSLESYQMMQEGAIERLILPQRYHQKEPPKITLLPLESKQKIITETVLKRIEEHTNLGQGVIVFHNRRGSIRGLECSQCRWVILCSQCDLPLVLHQREVNGSGCEQLLRCHHCGIRKKLPPQCPRCQTGAEHFKAQSFGTQKLQEDFKKALGLKVLRLDRDTAGDSKTIYKNFKKGEAQILIGTQLVTKGWHFPNVGLAVILDADTEMTMPDFRACERTFQTLLQVAGRTGRAQTRGEVLIATRHPQHYIFSSLPEGQWDHFYQKELNLRREMKLPPFTRLIAIELKGKDKTKVENKTEALHQAARDLIEKNDEPSSAVELIGKAPAFFQKIRGQWRYQIVLRLPKNQLEGLNKISELVKRHKSSQVAIRLHLDPYHLL